MDELKISSKFMRNIVSKLLSKALYKKLGYKASIQINELNVKINDGKANIHIDADAEINVDEFKKFNKFIGVED